MSTTIRMKYFCRLAISLPRWCDSKLFQKGESGKNAYGGTKSRLENKKVSITCEIVWNSLGGASTVSRNNYRTSVTIKNTT